MEMPTSPLHMKDSPVTFRRSARGRAVAAGAALLALSLLSGCIESIDPGKAGVLWTISGGTDLKTIYREGVQVIAPWNTLYIYDLRTQESRLSLHVLSVSDFVSRIPCSSPIR